MGGEVDVFGTDGQETVTALSGRIAFDPSFNQGGDTVLLDQRAFTFTATRMGSSVLLDSAKLDLIIPVGSSDITLGFASGRDDRSLTYDEALATVRIEDQPIGLTPVALPVIA